MMVDAVVSGQFAVHPVRDVDQGIELLTGIAAGERDAQGRFPEDSINGRVEDRLIEYSERMRAFSARVRGEGEAGS